jgi:hypothetical protein
MALEQIPSDILAAIPSSNSSALYSISSSTKQQHYSSKSGPILQQQQQQQHTMLPAEKDASAITRRMEDDRDKQKRGREETWALPLPASATPSTLGGARSLTKAQQQEMEMDEFNSIWNETSTGLLPEDHAVMLDYGYVVLTACLHSNLTRFAMLENATRNPRLQRILCLSYIKEIKLNAEFLSFPVS